MTDNAHEQIDDLFAQVRLCLLELRQGDPETVTKLKSLLSQLEDCVEQLVIDSLRLKSLEAKAKRAPQTRKKPRGKTGGR
jgi:phosphoribosylamine-glycine ligase